MTVIPILVPLVLLAPALGFSARRWARAKNLELAELRAQVAVLRREAEANQKEREALSESAFQHAKQIRKVYEMASALGASTNLGEATQTVISMVRRLHVSFNSCLLFLVRSDGFLEQVASEPADRVAATCAFLGNALREGKALLQDALPENPVIPDEHCVMLVPLRVRNETVGLIYLGSLRAHTHTAEHLERIKMLAAMAAPSIKSSLLFGKQEEILESERSKNQQLGGLQRLGAAIGGSLQLEETLQAVARGLKQMLPACQSVLFLTFGDKQLLKVEHADSPYAGFLGPLALDAGEGLLGLANASEEAVLIEDTQGEAVLEKERCALVAALRADGETLGFLYLGARQAGEFGDDHRRLVTTVAYQAALAINKARLYERTQQMAFTDGLTGLYLHRYFQEQLSREIAYAERNQRSLCLVMVDTDHFKTYNDTLGHPAGDALLKDIARLLRDKVRHSDVVCRYGGDEFAILLRDVPKEEAARTCERIRETFQLRFAAVQVQVTASIGLACYPSDARSKADLAQVADEALYVSKRGGRNRVTVAPALRR